ncbi:MAG: hypothetical protein KDA99_21555 [Planctomycetales bacterium]|nr:hypothetical protein [Planctomycetales bacterium]
MECRPGNSSTFSYQRLVKLLAVTACLLMFTGCWHSPYPQPAVGSPIGRTFKCEACGKVVENVSDTQFVTMGPSRFVVCDDQCAENLRQQMTGQ